MNVRVSQVGKLDAGGACSAGAQRGGCFAQQAVEVVKGKGPGNSAVFANEHLGVRNPLAMRRLVEPKAPLRKFIKGNLKAGRQSGAKLAPYLWYAKKSDCIL